MSFRKRSGERQAARKHLHFNLVICMPWQTREFQRKFPGNLANMTFIDYRKAELAPES